jgi:N-acetyl-gamma-glutamyl-phosphate reductase
MLMVRAVRIICSCQCQEIIVKNRYRVGVMGASGYAGQDLIEILASHPHAEIIFATSNTYLGDTVPFAEHLSYIPHDDADYASIDVLFLALPHKASAIRVKQALNVHPDIKILDLSADFRLDNAETYTKWYDVEHTIPELLPIPYGLPEINRSKLRGASLIAVPGCYPTATLLGLYPLLSMKGVALDTPIVVDAKSGVSGAGRNPKPNTHFVEVFGNLVPYNTGRKHRHVGEIEQEIKKLMPIDDPLIFTPHLLPVDRGLMASIYVALNYNITGDRVHNLYANVYGDEALIQLLPTGQEATLKHVVRTNRCTISVQPVGERYVHITSVIDNLRKGAAGQAVQCFNIMNDLPETTALV